MFPRRTFFPPLPRSEGGAAVFAATAPPPLADYSYSWGPQEKREGALETALAYLRPESAASVLTEICACDGPPVTFVGNNVQLSSSSAAIHVAALSPLPLAPPGDGRRDGLRRLIPRGFVAHSATSAKNYLPSSVAMWRPRRRRRRRRRRRECDPKGSPPAPSESSPFSRAPPIPPATTTQQHC